MTSSALAILALPTATISMQITRPWTTKHWCESVIKPEWPFAYSKYKGQIEETKGRVSTNEQDVRHRCDTRGVRSKCHICEDIVCGSSSREDGEGGQRCHFQLQGVSWDEMSRNIPTVSDVPWAVNGSHRYDFGGDSTTHVCMFLSGTPPCQSSFGEDYSHCELRCWGFGYNLSGANNTVTGGTRVEGEPDGTWPNHRKDSLIGVNSTPWELPTPTISWEYPKSIGDDYVPRNPIAGTNYSFNPQGFVFTLAGSSEGVEGFNDGIGSEARFRHPEGVAVDHEGYVYVADTGNHAIRIISPSGRVTTLAGTGEPGFKDGFVTEGAQFSSPTDIAVWRDWAWWPYENPVDPDSFLYRNGNGSLALFVADTANHRVRKITGRVEFDEASGEKTWKDVHVECFSGRCDRSPEPGYSDGKKEEGRFDSPQGVTVSHDGRVFVADTNNHLVRVIDQFGAVKTVAGSLQLAEIKRNGFEVEGCPEPCLSGTPGSSDGQSRQSHFSYPSDVSLESSGLDILVTDRHHIRRVDLEDNTVTTFAGAGNEGERDGIGSESSFNNPSSITVTGDGIAYIVDSASCRVRRVSRPAQLVPKISCEDDLSSIMRPSGCSSYNAPLDNYGLAATPVEGNIHYNFLQTSFDVDLGHDYTGRSMKNCVGSPPISRLDKKFWNDTVPLYPFNHNLVLDDGLSFVREDTNDGTKITVMCVPQCNDIKNFTRLSIVDPIGSDTVYVYAEEIPICGAALNEGILDTIIPTLIDIKIVSEHEVKVLGNTTEGLDESRQYFSVSKSSQETRVQTISGGPSSLRGQSCGFHDSFPPQSSRFKYPSGIGAFVNSSLDDTNHFMFIADRDNHAIRGMSATCTFRCENGGLCVGPDACKCKEGWTGLDCTKPVCKDSCSSRQVCVAPDICDCIPGFQGEDCLTAKCAQICENGGTCEAPDTCTCSHGWFDSNCTTPVCTQTCGNGGNCTGPDTCACPTDWTGDDCRTPVCEQPCSNGGWCVAPNTCLCTPDWSGYDCSMPVCHQGFFVPFDDLPESIVRPGMPNHWLEYQPCNFTAWCRETYGFDCSQSDRAFYFATPNSGMEWRHKTGRMNSPEECMQIELEANSISHFQYLSSLDNSTTSFFRYSPLLPYDWISNERLPWNAHENPQQGITQPYNYSIDRQIALVAFKNVTQGAYMCANGGRCVSPDVCSCARGWIGFDCRVPVCEQGYYEPDLEFFVKGVQSDDDFAAFQRFLDNRAPYNLDSSRGFSSNHYVPKWVERFINSTTIERELVTMKGSRYLAEGDVQFQGGYECSIRSVTEWENYRSGFVFDHPNFYSRYMDEKIEGDGAIYSRWTGMKFIPTHQKTAKLVKYEHEFVPTNSTEERSFMYTDEGYRKDGIWMVTGAPWVKGNCIVEFDRQCEGSFEFVEELSDEIAGVLVQDTDESYRPRITYDNKRSYISGRWFATKNDKCVDNVVRGCFNNGTCIGPNICQCSAGWTGSDCTIPVCEQTCLHNGNCTHPNICNCERGWTGADCSIAICSQVCNNGGVCVAPDTCQCPQWENEWRDGRIAGGVPIFRKANGDPQMTGWTGYDCATPICVQAVRFRLNVDPKSSDQEDVVPLGGRGKDGMLECDAERCPEYDEMVTQNDGASFQSGCGWDILETGCCFEIGGAYTCLRCENLEVSNHNATCSPGSLKEWHFEDISKVPLAFRTAYGKVLLCGPNLNPQINVSNFVHSHNSLQKGDNTRTSNMFLCNRMYWEQGDYIDDAGMSSMEAIGADYGLKSGRHIRVNFNKHYRSNDDPNIWIDGPEIEGEGIFECDNFGSCIAPDTCSCKDGYGGFDCGTPLCRHQQSSGKIVGCQNGGVCANKDDCHCIQAVSVLWKVHDDAERGLTGWTGSDCSMPMCIQGFYDPDCNESEFAPGKEGCYRCANGGFCKGPDQCQCAEGWSGYDCRTPVCKAITTPLIRKQLMTRDAAKIKIFEEDPCGMVGFSTLHDVGPRGVCTLPNQCTCRCTGSYNEELCRKLGGKYCQTPFHDPHFRRRSVLSPNQIFGTRNCYSGYEGLVDVNDSFGSCHLKIYEPTFFIRRTSLVFALMIFSFIVVTLLFGYLWMKFKQMKRRERRERRREIRQRRKNTTHAFAYDTRKRK